MIDRGLLIAACVCFGLDAVGVPSLIRPVSLGLLLWCLTALV